MTYTMKDLGCYFDGAYGFEYNAQRVIDYAEEYHDFTPTEIGDEFESFVWLMEEAQTHLNENTERPPNTYWNWEDGDFGLWLYCEQCGEVTDEDYTCCEEE